MFLEQGKTRAIDRLLAETGTEISFAMVNDRDVWLGLGWLVGKGWVVFRGDYHFRLTATGRDLAREYLTEIA